MSAHNGSGPRPGPDPSNPFTEIGEHTLRDLHNAGRQAFGADWPDVGPQLVADVTGGRTRASRQLTHDEGLELLAQLEAMDAGQGRRQSSKQLAIWPGRTIWQRRTA